MIQINLFGGPGVGKSTLAAEIFADLKKKHINCELVTEYAKDLTWQESFKVLKNQIYVWAKQHQRLFRLKDKVDVIVTDSPPILCILYDQENNDILHQLVVSEFNKTPNFNFVLERDNTLPFGEAGRYQTLDQAIVIDNNIISVLDKYNIHYTKVKVALAKEYILEYIAEQVKHLIPPHKTPATIEQFEENLVHGLHQQFGKQLSNWDSNPDGSFSLNK